MGIINPGVLPVREPGVTSYHAGFVRVVVSVGVLIAGEVGKFATKLSQASLRLDLQEEKIK